MAKEDNTLLIIVIVALALLLFGGFGMMGLGGFGGHSGMMQWMFSTGFGSFSFLFGAWIIQILFIVLLVLGIVWLVKQIRR
jgi:hypothetical protein